MMNREKIAKWLDIYGRMATDAMIIAFSILLPVAFLVGLVAGIVWLVRYTQ